jgi:para-nitrobenzyl esterase
LNVFTTNVARRGRSPVLLWIHGGGWFDGESNDYDASKLALGGPAGPTVVVTINYHLGLLGFLAHPALDAKGRPFADYGMMDQQAALHWVQQNIAAFGGDPDNVTLGCQSAGGSPPTWPGPAPRAFSIERSWAAGRRCICAIGLGGEARRQLCGRGWVRRLAVDDILKRQSGSPDYLTGLIMDGTILPIAAHQPSAAGRFNRVPIIIGTVEDEGGFAASLNEYFNGPLTAKQYVALVHAIQTGSTNIYNGTGIPGVPPFYPRGTDKKVLARYPLAAYASPSLAEIAVLTDTEACRARHLDHLHGCRSTPTNSATATRLGISRD